ncbi:hypothetical protein EV699_114155 [Plasticicumulans lactativorans]|uniref:DUF4351 domain-containing protein n=1 Tax=Plasticicumulans lactativorans TaxID=1133106 RepID=A0A4R2LCD7_9GAMM|nr:DUF4351 domain-containing protein [Plasticicumulans lactativorans]TCO80508.1 hypothetical protein EV699_114155 [Plasticicumulans lactativorans]
MLAERVQIWVKPWIEQGLLQGRREGASLLLCTLLRRRFGDLPEWADARLNAADEAQLGHWADRVLDAPTLDAVFAAPPQGEAGA